ncbi:MAG: chromosomal replication initiator protein DnaA [Phycisphaerales bacterium]
MSDGTLDVTVPNRFTRDLLERRFGPDLRRVLRDESARAGRELTLRFNVDGEAFASPTREAPPAVSSGHPAAKGRSSGRSFGKRRSAGAGRIDPAFRLEDFVVGDSNRMAFAAAVRLVEQAGAGVCAPLFIHGPCGLGKTHLLLGMANRFRELHPGRRVVYYPAEVFTNEFVMAVQNGTMNAFRKIFRHADLLCIDDVHFVAGKEATQNELLHTLDAIGLGRARIVLASDSHPRSISRFSEALVSRLVGGAVVRLDPPDLELRSRIIEHLAARRQLPLAPGTSRLIAEHAERHSDSVSVRDLEGLLTQIEAIWRLLPELSTAEGSIGAYVVQRAIETRRQGVSDHRQQSQRSIQIETILRVVCAELGVQMNELLGQGRHRRVVLARSMAALLARELTTRSYPEIAKAMARPSHSTIVSAIGRISKQMAANATVSVGCPHDGLTLRALADRLSDEVRKCGSVRARG